MSREDVVAAFDYLADEIRKERDLVQRTAEEGRIQAVSLDLLLFFTRRIAVARLIAKGDAEGGVPE